MAAIEAAFPVAEFGRIAMRSMVFGGVLVGMALAAGLAAAPARAADHREFVRMPAKLRTHMLASMRDHLATLNEILADLAAQRYDAASKVAETRLGMSSMGPDDAAQLGRYMPPGMARDGMALHHAASRFALAAQNADVDRSYKSMTRLIGSLSQMTAACAACHAGYRIR